MTVRKLKMDRYPKPGDTFLHLGVRPLAKVMAVVDNWVMARRPNAEPFVIYASQVEVLEES